MLHDVNSRKLVSRDRERERAMAAVLSGRGTAIVGAAGVGKTALVAAVSERLNPSRFAVTWTKTYPGAGHR